MILARRVWARLAFATLAASGDGQSLSLDRIRAGLQRNLDLTQPLTGPTFRTEVEGHVIKLRDYWIDDSNAVSSFVHPRIPQSHVEFLDMVRSPVGATGRTPFARVNNPYGIVKTRIFMIDVTPLMTAGQAAAQSVHSAMRERARKRVKARIRREVEAIEQAAPPVQPAQTPPAAARPGATPNQPSNPPR